MNFRAVAETYSDFYAPGYQVILDEGDIANQYFVEILSVTYEDVLDGADRFSITINDPGARWVDEVLFEPGKEIEIKMGYKDKLATMIVGEIISLRPSFPSDGTPQLEISGYDLSHQFTRVRRQRSFQKVRDSDVVGTIAGEAKHKLNTQIKRTDTVHPHIVQARQTDFDFIKGLADRNFFEFRVKGRTLHFQNSGRNRDAVMTLEYGSSLLSFDPELNTANQVSEANVRGWNPGTKTEIIGRAKRGSEEARDRGRRSGGDIVEGIYGKVEERILDRPVFTQQEADNLANSVLNRLSQGLVTGSARCIGIPEVRAGENVELQGLGNKFSKKYYIERTTHTISSSGYTTTFSVKENTI
jgi:phage protein D